MDNDSSQQAVAPEDRAWFNTPITVQVEQDDRAWLDTMLDMKPAELVNYAVFQYQVPEVAAQALADAGSRDELIQMIVVANRAGGGQSVSTQEYIYIPELKGIYEPMVSLFNEKSEPLYLVRGTGAARQIFNKGTEKWENLAEVRNKHTVQTALDRNEAAQAADSVANHPQFTPQPQKPTILDSIVPVLPSMKRADLVKIAADLGIDNGESLEAYPNNKALADHIATVNEANKAANGQEG